MADLVRILLLVLHGVSAMLLLGAASHQALSVWWPAPRPATRWWRSLRAVRPERYTQAIAVLFVATALLGAFCYPPFRAQVRTTYLDAQAPWATGLFEIKEHAAALALALLPAYWAAWREPSAPEGRRALTTFLTAAAWWNFIVGHVVNNLRGL
jgi:hypothetical protein